MTDLLEYMGLSFKGWSQSVQYEGGLLGMSADRFENE
jgi:hypothetical protein